MRLVLASASPRRAELLRAAGFTFETIVADVDERVRANESPSAYVRRLAAEKSAAVQSYVVSGFSRTDGARAVTVGSPKGGPYVPGALTILGADTVVVVDGEILGKPRDDAESAAMLRRLSGRRHEVLTGLSIRQKAFEVGRVETTVVWLSPLTEEDIKWYVGSGEGRDKAGAYAIQGLAARFIPRIDGSYSNVVGLPIAAVAELFRSVLASHPETGYSDL